MIEKETKKDITEISGAIVSFIIIILSLFALYSINLPSNVGAGGRCGLIAEPHLITGLSPAGKAAR